MKPSPLKYRKYSFITGEPPTCDWWCLEDDVRSAVEWLKNVDEFDLEIFRQGLINLDILKEKLNFNRNKAFEDAVQPKNELTVQATQDSLKRDKCMKCGKELEHIGYPICNKCYKDFNWMEERKHKEEKK